MDFDLSQFDDIFKIAKNGTNAASGAISLVSKVKTLLKSSESASNPELDGLVVDLTNQVQDTKLANLDLKEKLIMLREELVKFNYQETQFNRYVLRQTPAGDRVYTLKKTDETGEPPHSICPTCKENGKKSILQGTEYLSCKTCDVTYTDAIPGPINYAPYPEPYY